MLELLKQILYYPILNLVSFYSWLVPGGYVASGIILVTLTIRLILLAPSRRAAESQRKMSQLQPLLEELKAEYGEDKQGLATAQMELYKQNSINPFASCLPLLIQLPILIILYQAVRHGISQDTSHLYPWLPRPAHLNTDFFWTDLILPDKTYILPVIAAVLQYVQIKMTMPPVPPRKVGQEPDQLQLTQQYSLYMFPVVTLLAAHGLPAGASLYWVVGTVFSVVQQYFVNKKNLAVGGIRQAEKTADKLHPENAAKAHEVKREVEKAVKGGVSVTVRKKR